jgi:hypothetical protein
LSQKHLETSKQKVKGSQLQKDELAELAERELAELAELAERKG